MSTSTSWVNGATLYQVYPRSFADTNNDGVGDLKGVLSKLDYIKSLGVDGVWLSPFFTSPMRDFGYDVADYCNVDPLFGTLAAFDALVIAAHDHGLKLMIDQVYSHTSDQHSWFRESRHNTENSKSDWYVWADPKPDGSPPNNWLSVFGGPAWSWDASRRQYYLHNFLSEQPDLNFHQADVQDAILKVARFWLDRGVDGFRLDVINYCFHDAELRNNPPSAHAHGSRPYFYQRHIYNRSRPEALTFAARLRALTANYSDRALLGEVFSDAPLERARDYCAGDDRLHTAYSFHFLNAPRLDAALIQEAVEASAESSLTWSFSNHDVPRAVTRWGAQFDRATQNSFAKLLIALLTAMRGAIIFYQGDELGLPQAELNFEDLQDPEAKRFWPETLGRDGARTPFPWRRDDPNAGFSGSKPWLPVDRRHTAMAADTQENDTASVLSFARQAIANRQKNPRLRAGGIRVAHQSETIISIERTNAAGATRCIFNLGETAQDISALAIGRRTFAHHCEEKDGSVALKAFGVAFFDDDH
ncbi:MAG: alpha-amylase family glycosyl hydrolase [Pseudomonadota bacterium]